MPPRQLSRHTFTASVPNSARQSWLIDRIPFRFREFPDNKRYSVQQGDTLFHLAAKNFKPIVRPAGLWWILADFQPVPIHDPTIQLLPGRVLIIPSVRTVNESILSERRRRDTLL